MTRFYAPHRPPFARLRIAWVALLTAALLVPTVGLAQAQTLVPPFESPNAEENGNFGGAVAAVPDTDGDGVDDVLVGAFRESTSLDDVGRAYLFSGADGTLLHTLTSPNPEENGLFGASVAGVPDTDGDDRGDLLVGAGFESASMDGDGRAYLFSGADGTLLQTLTSPNAMEDGRFGDAVAGVPDTDGDGVGDLLVGEPGDTDAFPNTGRAYLLSGADGTLLQTFTSPDSNNEFRFGSAVAGTPDVNGDGTDDLLVADASEESDGSLDGAGAAYVFSGADGSLIHSLASPDTTQEGRFGSSVAGVPDTDGDGVGDLLIGAEGENQESGAAHLFSGADGTLLRAFGSPHPDFTFNFELAGAFGASVAGVPDLDGDDQGDLLIGAPREDGFFSDLSGGDDDNGRVYVFSGANHALLQTLFSPDRAFDGNFGGAVAGVSDADGDGRGDLLIGAPGESGGASTAGRAYLFSGARGGLVINEVLGNPDGAVDANGDGTIDDSDDEFVEIFNAAAEPIDVSGYQITVDLGTGTYTFPGGTTLAPGTGATIFGGGTPTGIPGFTDTGLPTLGDDFGDSIFLVTADGDTLKMIGYSSDEATGVSAARNHHGGGAFEPQDTFGPMTLHTAGQNNSDGSPLPVELASFTARADARAAVLSWRTASETNNAGFHVQRRTDDTDPWTRMDFVESQADGGTSAEPLSYQFRAEGLDVGAHAFRLVQTDLDGSTTPSDPVEVRIGLDATFALSAASPNPLRTRGTVEVAVRRAQEVTASLYDVLGRRVRVLHDGPLAEQTTHRLTVEVRDLSSGIYFVRVVGENFAASRKVVVVR